MLSPCAPEGLFVDRVAFTAEHLFQKLQSQPPSMYNVQLVAYSIYLIIEAASTMAGNMHPVQIFDWHAKNVAFTDSDPCEVKLLDWCNHLRRLELSGRMRMKQGLEQFLKYLPETAPEVAVEWKKLMRGLHDELKDWWELVTE